MKVLVIHHVNGATKSAMFEAPRVSRQMVDGGIHIALADVAGGPEVGGAMFTAAGLVALWGAAVEQYGPVGGEASDG